MGLTSSGRTLDLFKYLYSVPILALAEKQSFYIEMPHKANNM